MNEPLPSNPDCLFCKIASGVIPAAREHEDELCLAFRDINPAAPVHILLIPKEHLASVADSTAETRDVLGHLMVVAASLARKHHVDESGYRLVVNAGPEGGQSVAHLHLHLIGGRQMSWPPG